MSRAFVTLAPKTLRAHPRPVVIQRAGEQIPALLSFSAAAKNLGLGGSPLRHGRLPRSFVPTRRDTHPRSGGSKGALGLSTQSTACLAPRREAWSRRSWGPRAEQWSPPPRLVVLAQSTIPVSQKPVGVFDVREIVSLIVELVFQSTWLAHSRRRYQSMSVVYLSGKRWNRRAEGDLHIEVIRIQVTHKAFRLTMAKSPENRWP